MNTVVEQFGRYSANSLVTITYRQSPWTNAYRKRKIISKESIGDYFRELLKGNR